MFTTLLSTGWMAEFTLLWLWRFKSGIACFSGSEHHLLFICVGDAVQMGHGTSVDVLLAIVIGLQVCL